MINKSIREQEAELVRVLLKNSNIREILKGNPFPEVDNWYLGAGCLCQSVWNYLSGRDIADDIKDYDLVYYCAKGLTKTSERKEQQRVRDLFNQLPIEIDVVNEARVHLWFERDFGKKINQFKSCEDAINQWPTTATAVGINKIGGRINIYAPYGLNDLFGMVVRPNKPFVLKHVYESKVERWARRWPNLKLLPWQQV